MTEPGNVDAPYLGHTTTTTAADLDTWVTVAASGADRISLFINGAKVPVTVGIADSGGAGFRLLRIPN